MKYVMTVIAAALLAGPVSADDNVPSPEIVERIEAMLAEMECQMDPKDIEVEEDGYDLDDVICREGQFDIKLDLDLNEVSRRAE